MSNYVAFQKGVFKHNRINRRLTEYFKQIHNAT